MKEAEFKLSLLSSIKIQLNFLYIYLISSMKLFRKHDESYKMLNYKIKYCFKVQSFTSNLPSSLSSASCENSISCLNLNDKCCESPEEISIYDNSLVSKPLVLKGLDKQSKNDYTKPKPSFNRTYKKKNSQLKKNKKTAFKNGRWTRDEHRRFIEAIFNFGSEWKRVEKHILSRTSAQSRSHSQKFFMKLAGYMLPELNQTKPCIDSLHNVSKKMTELEKERFLNKLLAYEYTTSESNDKRIKRHLGKKRILNIVEHKPKKAIEEKSLHQQASFSLKSNISRLSLQLSEEELFDEFNNNFYKVFEYTRNRTLSFDDNKNLFLLCGFGIQENYPTEMDNSIDYIQCLQ